MYDDRIRAGEEFLALVDEAQSWPPHPEFGPHDVLLAHLPLPYVTSTTPARPVQPVLDLAPSPAGLLGGSGSRWAADQPRWEQSIAIGELPMSAYVLHGPVPRGPVAFVRTDPQPATLHPLVDETDFAAPMLPGWDDKTAVANVLGTQDVTVGVPAEPVTWSLMLSDWLGRWGEPSSIQVDPPLPPPLPPPTIDLGLTRSEGLLGTQRVSPGQVHVRCRIPTEALPGALPLQRITWTADGMPQQSLDLTHAIAIADAPALIVTAQFSAAPTVPGERHTTTVTAQVEDIFGNKSDLATGSVDTSDARAVRPPTIAPRLLTTSRRTGDPNVSITLTVRAAGNGAYRFYLASEPPLRTAAHIDPPRSTAPTRALRAQELRELSSDNARRASMPVLAEPVPVKQGVATARLEIPAGSMDILAVRAVPVTAELNAAGQVIRDGVEAPFKSVEPTFVVVPYDEVPPVPELQLTPDGPQGAHSTRVKATVAVRGVPAAVLHRYAAEPMQARLVEASTGGDPWFWPQIATASLVQSPEVGTYRAETTFEVPAWSRTAIAVAVRYPPEDTVVPGIDLIDDPELDATGPQGPQIESPWGPISVPAWIQVEGPEPEVTVEPDHGGGFLIRVAGLPPIAPADNTFRVDLFGSASGTDVGALLFLSGHPVTKDSPLVAIEPDVAAGYSRLAAQLVTPFGVSRRPPMIVGP